MHGRNDINIVPMLDVMVILIFFLIFTAVFSKMNILELNLPVDGGPPPELPAVLELEVIVRQGIIEVADRNTGPAPGAAATLREGPDYTGLSNFLRRVKIRFPEKKDATVLLESDMPYDTMVQTMDTMKSFDTRARRAAGARRAVPADLRSATRRSTGWPRDDRRAAQAPPQVGPSRAALTACRRSSR